MKRITRSSIRRSALACLVVAGVGAQFACHSSDSYGAHRCKLVASSEWENYGLDYIHSEPRNCALEIPFGVYYEVVSAGHILDRVVEDFEQASISVVNWPDGQLLNHRFHDFFDRGAPYYFSAYAWIDYPAATGMDFCRDRINLAGVNTKRAPGSFPAAAAYYINYIYNSTSQCDAGGSGPIGGGGGGYKAPPAP